MVHFVCRCPRRQTRSVATHDAASRAAYSTNATSSAASSRRSAAAVHSATSRAAPATARQAVRARRDRSEPRTIASTARRKPARSLTVRSKQLDAAPVSTDAAGGVAAHAAATTTTANSSRPVHVARPPRGATRRTLVGAIATLRSDPAAGAGLLYDFETTDRSFRNSNRSQISKFRYKRPSVLLNANKANMTACIRQPTIADSKSTAANATAGFRVDPALPWPDRERTYAKRVAALQLEISLLQAAAAQCSNGRCVCRRCGLPIA